MSLGVHLLHVLGVDTGLNLVSAEFPYKCTHSDELGEVLLVFLLILLGEGVHVFGDVATEDVLLVDIGVELAIGESWEALWRVGDVQTGIGGTLQDTEDTGTS